MYLGIDIGTSSVKAVLMDRDQHILGSRSAGLEVSRPHPGWSEQDPESWWTACLAVLDGLAADFPREMAAVKGIGLSGHMHGATLLGASDEVLRPCILWNDGRSAAEAAEISGPSERITGNIAMPGFTAPKLLWVKRHEPEVFAKVKTVLLPKDYVRLRLTGDKASEMSDSAGTLWLDTAKRAWSDEMLALTDLDRSAMPELFEGSEATGTLRPELAERWGMSGRVVLAGGGGDNAASGCGVGAVAPGTGFISIGTSGVVFVTADQYRANPEGAVHAFCHAVPGTWHQMGVALSAAGSLEWLSHVMEEDPGKLVAPLGDMPAGPSPVRFLPYLSGERTPHNDVAIRGAFAGLDSGTSRTDMTQAVLEGVAFSFRNPAPDALPTTRTVDPAQIRIDNGQWYLQGWCHLRTAMRTFHLDRVSDARLTDIPITHADSAVPAEFGAGDGPEGEVTVRIPERLAPLIGSFPQEELARGGGLVTLRIRMADPRGIKRVAGRFGGALEVLDPPLARATTHDWASAGLDLYKTPGPRSVRLD